MKKTLIAVAGTIVTLCLPVQAQEVSGLKEAEMPGQQETKPAPTAKASGTVKAIDIQKSSVTLAHGAVPALQWPPMTMSFKATPKQLAELKVGDQVAFEFHTEGMQSTIVSIDTVK